MEEYVVFLGIFAGVLTTFSNLPQLIKVIRSKSTKDISIWTYVMSNIGVIMWLFYGIALESVPLILANSLTLLFSGSILYIKLTHP